MTQNQQMSCPICMKSYMDMAPYWQHLDAEIAVTPMPQDYANWRVDILCNDCNKPSRVQFHILGLKCSHCRSYNTRRIRLEENQAVLDARLIETATTATQRDSAESAPSELHDEAEQWVYSCFQVSYSGSSEHSVFYVCIFAKFVVEQCLKNLAGLVNMLVVTHWRHWSSFRQSSYPLFCFDRHSAYSSLSGLSCCISVLPLMAFIWILNWNPCRIVEIAAVHHKIGMQTSFVFRLKEERIIV